MIPLLTIAIPTYNRLHYLKRLLTSIFNQYDSRLEIIVSDNDSTDGTESYVKTHYQKIKYYKNETNVGMENFQRCYQRASGRYVWLIGDDDIITEESLSFVLHFLEQDDSLSLIFLNHIFFYGEYKGLSYYRKPFFSDSIKSFITTDKTQLISIAKYQLTFMSCFIISKDKYMSIDAPDQYNSHHFLQTCIAFQVSKDLNAKLGIISKICIAQNSSNPNIRPDDIDFDFITEVFCKEEKEAYCNVGVQCGYDEQIMKQAHSDYLCSTWPGIILNCKINKIKWAKTFWTNAFPLIWDYPKIWISIMPVVLLPSFFMNWIRSIKHFILDIPT